MSCVCCILETSSEQNSCLLALVSCWCCHRNLVFFFFVGGNIIILSQCSQDSMLCLLSGGFVLVVFLMSCFGSSVDARKTVPQVINWYLGYMELIRQSKWNYLYLSRIFMCLKHCGAPIDIWQCREHGGNVQLKFRGHDKWKLLYVESLLNEHSSLEMCQGPSALAKQCKWRQLKCALEILPSS